MVFPKFIIEDNLIILGQVKFHRELAKDPSAVEGGGWFFIDSLRKEILFYGKSYDFGRFNIFNLKSLIESGNLDSRLHDYTFYLSLKDFLTPQFRDLELNPDIIKVFVKKI
jgi:hypothetical protein